MRGLTQYQCNMNYQNFRVLASGAFRIMFIEPYVMHPNLFPSIPKIASYFRNRTNDVNNLAAAYHLKPVFANKWVMPCRNYGVLRSIAVMDDSLPLHCIS